MPLKTWKRPLSISFPSVWSKFNRNRDGKELHFEIQDITEDEIENCIQHMVEHFLRDEPLSKIFGILSDPVSVDEIMNIWRDLLKERLGLVCLVWENKNYGVKPKIAGVNFTHYHHISHEDIDLKLKGDRVQKSIDSVLYIEDKVDQYNILNITEYINAYGLSVHPNYRGLGISTELIKAREPLAKAVGISTTITMFTNLASQKAAYKAGFQNLCEVGYKELSQQFPDFNFNAVDDTTIKYMYKKYQI